MNIKQLTLVVPRRDGKVLLGMKKRGFGAGKWNGFGGKVEPGETIEGAAFRELLEEVGLQATTLKKHAITDFSFEGKEDEILRVHIFSLNDFSGEPRETDEMRPSWYDEDKIPYEVMWVDDIHWFPKLLQNETWNAKFHFSNDGNTILEKNFYPFEELS